MIDQCTQCKRPLTVTLRRQALPVRPATRMPWRWIGLCAALLVGLAASALWFLSGRGAEAQDVRLGSPIGGRVAAVEVAVGQRVEAGKVLVRFEDQEFVARRDQAQARLATARAAQERTNHGVLPEEIAEAEAAAEAARARLERARAGSREEQKRQAQGELEAALADQGHTEADLMRAARLLRGGAVSQAEYDAALAAHRRADARVHTAQAALDLVLHGVRLEEIAEAKADYARLQARLDLLRRGARSEDRAAADAAEAQLAEAKAALRQTVVTAPEHCVVEDVPARPGTVFAAGQPVIVVRRAADVRAKGSAR